MSFTAASIELRYASAAGLLSVQSLRTDKINSNPVYRLEAHNLGAVLYYSTPFLTL